MAAEGDMDSDFRFYTRRAAEETARADRSVTPAARDRHRQLASEFAKRARDLDEYRRQSAS